MGNKAAVRLKEGLVFGPDLDRGLTSTLVKNVLWNGPDTLIDIEFNFEVDDVRSNLYFKLSALSTFYPDVNELTVEELYEGAIALRARYSFGELTSEFIEKHEVQLYTYYPTD